MASLGEEDVCSLCQSLCSELSQKGEEQFEGAEVIGFRRQDAATPRGASEILSLFVRSVMFEALSDILVERRERRIGIVTDMARSQRNLEPIYEGCETGEAGLQEIHPRSYFNPVEPFV